MDVLKFLNKKEIGEIFDKDSYLVINYLLKKVLFSQPETRPGKKRANIQITKEFLEQWIAQGLGWETVGSGSYPIDVYSKKYRCGADVKFMSVGVNEDGSFTKESSGETSLGQKFKGSGKDLDQDFADKKYSKILNGWKNILIEKINKPIKDYELNNIYYFIFIRGGKTISLAVAKVNVNKIKNLEVSKTTDSSIFIEGYINNKYGNVKIYKAKKRMELRCCPKKMEDDNLFINWNFDGLIDEKGKDLRLLVRKRLAFKKYVKEKLNKMFKSL